MTPAIVASEVIQRKRRGLGKFSFIRTVISVVIIVVFSAFRYLQLMPIHVQQPLRLILQINEPMQLQTINGKLHLQLQDPNNGTPRLITGEGLKLFTQSA